MSVIITITVGKHRLKYFGHQSDSLAMIRQSISNYSDSFVDYEGYFIERSQEDMFKISEVTDSQNKINMLPSNNNLNQCKIQKQTSINADDAYFQQQSSAMAQQLTKQTISNNKNNQTQNSQQTQLPILNPQAQSQLKESSSNNQNTNVPIKGSKEIGKIGDLALFLYPRYKKAEFNTNELNLLRVIMVIGQTGSGKSTLLDAMVNYITGVTFEDKFRYKLIDENNLSQLSDVTKSSTEKVNGYYIKAGKNLNYPIVLIDTPGFNDTEGIMRDKEITKDISDFFQSTIQEIHCVCLVSISSLARLTCAQQYVYSRVLEIFGKDIEENIANLFTFCDGGKPLVKSAVESEKIPTKYFYKFNNSALFEYLDETDDCDTLTKMFWEMGYSSLKKFFDDLNSKFKAKSLTQTKEVLKERQKLDHTIANLRPRIDQGLNRLDSAKNELIFLQRHKMELDQNKDFVYQFTEQRFKKIPTKPGIKTTTCQVCNKTCHADCAFSNDEDKKECLAMKNDNCTVCIKKCHWSHHSNLPYIFQYYTHKENRTNQQLFQKYTSAQSNVSKVDQVLMNLAKELQEIRQQIYNDIEQLHLCLQRLSEIALRPHPFSALDLIENMIESEQVNKKSGYQKRLEGLQEIKKHGKKKDEALSQYFDDYKQTLDDLQKNKITECSIF